MDIYEQAAIGQLQSFRKMEVAYVSKCLSMDAIVANAGCSVHPRVVLVLADKYRRQRAGMRI